MGNFLKENERVDNLEINGYQIIQNKDMFCFGIDAVLLSDFSKAKSEENVLDLCTGNGIVPILMHAKGKGNKYLGIDINNKNIDMAKRSTELNQISSDIDWICNDIKEVKQFVQSGKYTVVTCNPPYMVENSGYKNENKDKLIARHEIMCTIEDIMKSAGYILKTKGRMYMIHRPNRLVDIIENARKYKLEPKRIQFIHSYEGKKPSMVLIECIKNGKPDLNVEEPLVIYKQNGEYTNKILKIYGKA